MTKTKPLVTLIVPVYNGKKFIDGFIDSLKKQSIKDWHCIFIDDASTDKSYGCLTARTITDKRITLLLNCKNQGYANCINTGYREVSSKYFVCMNVDVKFDENFLSDLIMSIESDDNIAMVCPLAYKDKSKDVAFFNDIFYNKKQTIGLTTTGNIGFIDAKYKVNTEGHKMIEVFYHGVFLAKYDVINRICGCTNLFDDDYYMYCEDLYLCWKIRQHSANKVYVNPKILYWHHCGSSRIDSDIDKKATFHGTKNKIMTLLIFHRYSVIIRILPLIFISELIYLFYDIKKIPLKLKAYLWILTNLRKIHQKHKKEKPKHTLVNRDYIEHNYMNSKIYEPLRGNKIVSFLLNIINAFSYVYLKITMVR